MREERSLSPSIEDGAGSEFRSRFARLCSVVEMHPAESTAAATFEAAASSARSIAADCLPLATAVVMHLYPLCALSCVPLPWWSAAHWRRALLLHDIHRCSLILANAGSERAACTHATLTAQRVRGGLRVNGTCEYMSLAHVANLVLFSAPLSGSHGSAVCAATLSGPNVRIGSSKFVGSMGLSDTCSVTFDNHFVASHRFIAISDAATFDCVSQYQRSWFQLLIGESYLARIGYLQDRWNLPRSAEQGVSLNELSRLREYALRLLDEATPSSVESLARLSAAMKLRISWHAQLTAAALKGVDDIAASELGYLRLQPTSDARILANIGEKGDGSIFGPPKIDLSPFSAPRSTP